jgi:hypothetical protein
MISPWCLGWCFGDDAYEVGNSIQSSSTVGYISCSGDQEYSQLAMDH